MIIFLGILALLCVGVMVYCYAKLQRDFNRLKSMSFRPVYCDKCKYYGFTQKELTKCPHCKDDKVCVGGKIEVSE